MALIKCGGCGQEISKKAKVCPKCGHPNPKAKNLSGCTVFVVLGLVVGFIWMWAAALEKNPPSSTPSPHRVAMDNMEIMDFSWEKSGFGSVMIFHGSIVNKGEALVKDVKIKCVHFSASKSPLGESKETAYEFFPPGKTVKIKDLNMGFINDQAVSTRCNVVDLKLVK